MSIRRLSETRCFALDAGVRRREAGRLLSGGTPPRFVRLSGAGGRALDALLGRSPASQGGPAPPSDTAAATLAGRLEEHGLIHPLPGDGTGDPEVTAVVPVRDGVGSLEGLVRTLASEGPVIVVDDGSRDGSGERAERAGARVLRHDLPRGPAAARNAGLAAAETEFVAFVDADCEAEAGWRRGLAGLLGADPRLAVVGPRIRSTPGGSALERFEAQRSPLDLGPHASLVGPERRVAYLPAAALVARRDALLEVGGFDESLRYGEDVDLIWRLLAPGWRVRYAPGREIRHRPRATVGEFARQRMGYGSSAPDLAARHGDAVAPLQATYAMAAGWSAGIARGPGAWLAAAALTSGIAASRGRDAGERRARLTIAVAGQASGVTHLSRALCREWLPVGAALLATRRGRRLMLAATLLDTLPVVARQRPADLPAALGLHALDRAAYAAGLWRRAIGGNPRALLPRLTRGGGRRPRGRFFRRWPCRGGSDAAGEDRRVEDRVLKLAGRDAVA